MDQLPAELLQEISLRLDYDDTVGLAQTCRRVWTAVDDRYFWARKLARDYAPLHEYVLPADDPRETYELTNEANNLLSMGDIRLLAGELQSRVMDHATGTANIPLIRYLSAHSGLWPRSASVNDQVGYGNIRVLKKLASLDPPVLPDSSGVRLAIKYGDMQLLEWLAAEHPAALSDKTHANYAARRGDIDVLELLAALDPPNLPSQMHADEVARRGYTDVLKWLAARNPPILPSWVGADMAAQYGRIRTVEWLLARDPPILPASNMLRNCAPGVRDLIHQLIDSS